jgi:hypothetical protein
VVAVRILKHQVLLEMEDLVDQVEVAMKLLVQEVLEIHPL